MIKKICILMLLTLLVSCWDDEAVVVSDSSSQARSWLILFDNNNFSIGIPAAWDILEDTQWLLPEPSSGTIELASSSTDLQNGFSNNILILSQDLTQTTSSKDFSLLNHIWVQNQYTQYVKLDTKDLNFNSWDDTVLYVFEAKYNLDTPKLQFIQTAAVCNNTKWYLITIALPTSIKDIDRYEDILTTFSCK